MKKITIKINVMENKGFKQYEIEGAFKTVTIPGFKKPINIVTHRPYQFGRVMKTDWTCTHFETGYALDLSVPHKTQSDAISFMTEKLEKIGEDRYLSAVNSKPVINKTKSPALIEALKENGNLLIVGVK